MFQRRYATPSAKGNAMKWIMLGLLLLATTSITSADEPYRFRWNKDDRLEYQITHTTTITEIAPLVAKGSNETTTRTTKLALSKYWTVAELKTDGSAVLELTITRMKQEISKPLIDEKGAVSNEMIVMDSGTPEGKESMAAFLNKPILKATVDFTGLVKDVESGTGDSAKKRLAAELPFRVLLPKQNVKINDTWDRTFNITVDPPLGTGEVYEVTQRFKLRAIREDHVVIGVTTELLKPPSAPVDLQPLLPWLWEGDVFFDPRTGRYSGSKLNVKKVLKNHRGDGTEFRFESEYTEAAAGR